MTEFTTDVVKDVLDANLGRVLQHKLVRPGFPIPVEHVETCAG